MAKEKAWDATAGKKSEKTIDEKIAGFERELNRFDRVMEAQKDKIKADVEDLEHSFDDFMDDLGLDVDKMRDQFDKEMENFKKEVEFSTKALKSSFDHFMEFYKDRGKKA